MDVVYALLAGLAGILVGGVLNLLADDLPAREHLHPPRYPDGSRRPLAAWLGITAFLTARRQATSHSGAVEGPGRRKRISWRYPLVEIVTGLAYAALTLWYADEPGVWAWYVYIALLILIAVIDLEHRLILFAVIVPASAFALVVAAVAPAPEKSFVDYVVGGLVGFGVFFLMFLGGAVFTRLTRNSEVAFGFGDVMLATLSGLILGWQAFIFATFITVIAGALGAVLFIVGRALMGRRYAWFTPLPYGPYIVIGTLALLLFSEQIKDVFWAAY